MPEIWLFIKFEKINIKQILKDFSLDLNRKELSFEKEHHV